MRKGMQDDLIDEAFEKLELAREAEAPLGRTALELHQEVYRNRRLPLPLRLRAAREALPYEEPRLAVVAKIADDGSFAERHDRALARSHPKTIDHRREDPE
jgi:hypothetical protein